MTKNLQFGYFETEELKDVYKFKNIGKNVHISKAANIVGSENISLGNNIRIDNFTNIICKNGYINIGDHNHVASGCFILGSGGVEKTAKEFEKEFLGNIPINPEVGRQGDSGIPIVESLPEHDISKIYINLAKKIKNKYF